VVAGPGSLLNQRELKRTDGQDAFVVSILKGWLWLAPFSYRKRRVAYSSEGLREVWEGEVSLVMRVNTVFGSKMVCTCNKMATTTVSTPVGPGRFYPHQFESWGREDG